MGRDVVLHSSDHSLCIQKTGLTMHLARGTIPAHLHTPCPFLLAIRVSNREEVERSEQGAGVLGEEVGWWRGLGEKGQCGDGAMVQVPMGTCPF